MSDTLYIIHTITSFSFLFLLLGWCVRGALHQTAAARSGLCTERKRITSAVRKTKKGNRT
jgi:uncharacterized membrane protein